MKIARIFKAPEAERQSAKARRDAVKTVGGADYGALLERERAARKLFRQRHPDKAKASRRKHKPLKAGLCHRARRRARKCGMAATISAADIYWPTHCSVLGIELDYSPRGQRHAHNPANPTLDRWDNTKGYVPGNVFVISMRANTLKNNATWQELEKVMRYARDGLNFVRLVA